MDEVKQAQPVATPVAEVPKKKFDSTFAELNSIQNTVKKFKPGDVVIPLMTLISLGLLTAFVYLPMVTSAIEFRKESKDVAEKITQLNNFNKDLDTINVTTLQNDLTNARSVMPFSLQVSDFLGYVDDAAKSKSLIFKDILAGDISVRSDSEASDVDPVIKGVSGPLKYEGSLSQITAFLDQLQDASPYIISTDQVRLRKQTTDKWELSLTVTGFYLNQSSLPKVNIYQPFTKYTNFSDTLNVFEEKANKLGK